MMENLRRITVAEYLDMTAVGDSITTYYHTWNWAWRKIARIDPIPNYPHPHFKLINTDGLYQVVESDDYLWIECSAEEALEDDRARIGRNLAYWRQLRLSAMRQQQFGVLLILWHSAYYRSCWWEDALTRLEVEYATDYE